MKSIDEIMDEISAYEKLRGKRLTYGDYVWKVQPRLSAEEYREICKCAENIKKDRERKKRLQEVRASGLNKGRKAKHESDIPYWDW